MSNKKTNNKYILHILVLVFLIVLSLFLFLLVQKISWSTIDEKETKSNKNIYHHYVFNKINSLYKNKKYDECLNEIENILKENILSDGEMKKIYLFQAACFWQQGFYHLAEKKKRQ